MSKYHQGAKLRPYQQEMVNKIQDGENVMLLPRGLGKGHYGKLPSVDYAKQTNMLNEAFKLARANKKKGWARRFLREHRVYTGK